MNRETKNHIDAARQVLVGVVPNPSSQIDQITNALIYKFMDDMDQAAIKKGGKPSFFIGDLEKFAWTKIMNACVDIHECMDLYAEALLNFSKSKHLPELFRSIFKLAFLPYRSPETLALFLKEINYFDYSHPEELGNAYEYLLSIMSSQGDAGQFRTPRHIIDFMVEVMNPNENNKVLDPACGTAGFLISSYKHILKQYNQRHIMPEARKKLMNNFEGYDIDPGMVRIAQVNMYLHQFKHPKILQYDTLSSDANWDDKFDIIFANPPFMSPKGGINPHNKFSVLSTRSEVLFVDYIMNHLRAKGRAAIIVPEGIIFQSATVYKQLRKNLIENGLYSVVSLPAGIFKPYSGVKTSILLVDNEIAKKSKDLVFIKVANDGFELGAKRKANKKNDLPEALDILNKFKAGKKVKSKIATYVKKSQIMENEIHNLSADRYLVAADYSETKCLMVELREVCEILSGYAFKSDFFNKEKNGMPLIRIRDINSGFSKTYYSGKYDEKYVIENEDLLIGMDGDFVASIWHNGKALLNQRVCKLQNFSGVSKNYIYYLIQKELNAIHAVTQAVTVKHISAAQIGKIKIPLPPLKIQEQIVANIAAYKNIVMGSNQAIANWKPKIEIDAEWKKVTLPDISKNHDSKRRPVTKSERSSGKYPYYGASGIVDHVKEYIFDGDYLLISEDGANLLSRNAPIAFSISGKNWVNNHAHILKFDNHYAQKFVETYINQIDVSSFVAGVVQPKLNQRALNKIEIPLPSLALQKEIVEEIEAEYALIESAKKISEIYGQKIKTTISELWYVK
jgi:type I restriction enzyme M protein